MTEKKILNEYEAAAFTGLSPELLKWLTRHAPKQGDQRKLKVSELKGDVRFYDETELFSFNEWLKAPWPSKGKQRPPVPAGIRNEIRTEANGECAICQSHRDTCEAAHLDPVAQSKNNHPENLIWLCCNHHTTYDNGLFGPDEENAEFVKSFKIALHRFKLMLWRTQADISHKLFVVLETCDQLEKQLEQAKTKEQTKAIEKLAKKTLSVIPKLSPLSKSDPKYKEWKEIETRAVTISKDKNTPIATRLKKAQEVKQDYVAAFEFVECPLCEGSGRHNDLDCPVCGGDREIEKFLAERVDLSDFEKVDCPLCNGKGKFRGEDCPECGGNAQIDRRFAQQINPSDYQKVTCPLCDGERFYDGGDCPECGGEGEMDSRDAAKVDLSDYKRVPCPLCEGEGYHDGEQCPVCGGDMEMDLRDAKRVDLDDYKLVNCPLCKGSGYFDSEECPACHGERKMEAQFASRIDLADFELVTCPVCKGKRYIRGEDCRACGGEGKMQRRHANDLD